MLEQEALLAALRPGLREEVEREAAARERRERAGLGGATVAAGDVDYPLTPRRLLCKLLALPLHHLTPPPRLQRRLLPRRQRRWEQEQPSGGKAERDGVLEVVGDSTVGSSLTGAERG